MMKHFTPAAGVVITELMSGGSISGNVLGTAGQAGIEGLKNVVDPLNIAKKVAKKVVTKGRSVGKD